MLLLFKYLYPESIFDSQYIENCETYKRFLGIWHLKQTYICNESYKNNGFLSYCFVYEFDIFKQLYIQPNFIANWFSTKNSICKFKLYFFSCT